MLPTLLARPLEHFQALRSRTFAKLYFAQTISLLSDTFTWVGRALLAYQFGWRYCIPTFGQRVNAKHPPG